MKKNKTAIVTGGAKGIGYSVSRSLAASGWDLIICGRDEFALREVSKNLVKEFGIEATPFSLDLSSQGSLERFFEFLRGREFPSALVCNAGNYGTLGPLSEVNFEDWKRSFDLNFFSVAQLIQLYVLAAEKQGAGQRKKVVVMGGAGLGGARIWPGISAYSCAKAALYRLVEVLHEELHAKGFDINCVAPGAVKTGITDQAEKAGASALGVLFQETLKVKEKGGDSPELAAATIEKLLSSDTDGFSGRLVSAKWDGALLNDCKRVSADPDLLRLRRIDNELYGRIEAKK